jgi:hypothetical protein
VACIVSTSRVLATRPPPWCTFVIAGERADFLGSTSRVSHASLGVAPSEMLRPLRGRHSTMTGLAWGRWGGLQSEADHDLIGRAITTNARDVVTSPGSTATSRPRKPHSEDRSCHRVLRARASQSGSVTRGHVRHRVGASETRDGSEWFLKVVSKVDVMRSSPDARSFRCVLPKSGGSSFDGKELPAAWDPFQVVLTSILELNARASNQVLHCGRNQNLVRSGQGCYSLPDVNGDPSNI